MSRDRGYEYRIRGVDLEDKERVILYVQEVYFWEGQQEPGRIYEVKFHPKAAEVRRVFV
jgi:hypothetical protein